MRSYGIFDAKAIGGDYGWEIGRYLLPDIGCEKTTIIQFLSPGFGLTDQQLTANILQ